MKTFKLLILFFFSLFAYGQSESPQATDTIDIRSKATSDNYFRRGMDLCEKGEYEDAISCFEMSKSYLIKSNVNQIYHGYDDIWIGYCKSVLEDIKKNNNKREYNNRPFNRFEYYPVDSLLCIATQLVNSNEVEEACMQMSNCIKIVLAKGNTSSLLWADWRLTDFVNLLIDSNNNEDAILFSSLMLKIRRLLYEKDNENVIEACIVLFQLYKEGMDYPNAIVHGQTILELTKDNHNVSSEIYPSVAAGTALCMSNDNVELYVKQIKTYIKEMRELAKDIDQSDIDSYSNMYLDAIHAAENIKDYELAYDICNEIIPFLRNKYPFSDEIRDHYCYVLDFLASYHHSNKKYLLEQISLEEMKEVAMNNSNFWYLTAITKLLDVYCRCGEYNKASELHDMSKQTIFEFIEQSSKSNMPDDIGQAGIVSYRLAWYYCIIGMDYNALTYGKDAFNNLRRVYGDNNRFTLLAGTDLMGYYIKIRRWQDAKDLGMILTKNLTEDNPNYDEFMPKISKLLSEIKDN